MDRATIVAAMQAAAPKPRAVEVPAWGGTIYVRVLTLAEAEDLGASADKKRNIARGLAAIIVDQKGRRVFDPNSDEDLEMISSQSFEDLQPLITAARGGRAETAEDLEKLGNFSTAAKS